MFAAKNELFTSPSGYQISRSVRLRSSASAYFNRTPASTTNQTTWTYSAWIKRGALSTGEFISASDSTGGTNFDAIDVDSNTFRVYFNGTSSAFLVTTAVYRDPSAWYHLVVSVDTTQATASNRIKMYVNGVQVTSFSTSTYPSQNYATFFNLNGRKNTIGANAQTSPGQFFDGYFTEINFIDGQALTPTSFGQFNSVTGVWQPLKYTGTYGTNGFYLNFSDNSNNTAATIGKDYSGNGNNWTPNNISVTSGVTYDSMLDVPTNYADGGNGRGNYAVMNPLDAQGTATLSDANLTLASATTAHKNRKATFLLPNTGKWYWELTTASTCSSSVILGWGLQTTSAASDSQAGNANTWMAQNDANQDIFNQTTTVLSTGSAVTGGSIRQVAYDADTGKLWFGVNNSWYSSTDLTSGNPSAGTNQCMTLSAGDYFPAITCYNLTANANFGQRPFTYTPPTGFVALNTQNLPAPTISNGALYMAATTYTGNGASRSITNGGNNTIGTTFQPDFAWIKSRSNALNSGLMDSVRGPTKLLISNATNAEQTLTDELTSFNSNGFSLGVSSNGYTNFNTYTYVAWQWQAGAGTTSSNTSGSITSTVSVNATAGFSVVTFNAGSAGNQSFGHGLGVAPNMVILKDRANAVAWPVYHSSAVSATNQYLVLNLTAATQTSSGIWGAALPTSTVVGFGSNVAVTANANCVAYCFSAVAGYSAFGSYTGNGSTDGPFVYLGFRPRFIMTKRTDSTSDWQILDTSRNTYNVAGSALFPNSSSSETTNGWYDRDFLSNGFKIRASVTEVNASGGTYVYACFAENPYKLALAR